jgi:hypothetical protein
MALRAKKSNAIAVKSLLIVEHSGSKSLRQQKEDAGAKY